MTRERGAAARWRLLLGTAAALLALDQASKLLVMACIPEHRPVPVIPGVFDLVNIRNRGAAFGFLNRSDIEWQFWLFLAATLVAVWAIVVLARSTRRPLLLAGLGLILGGALGNLVDRLRFRAGVDFLDLYWRGWHWPAFNVADMGICLGAVCACLALWRPEREHERPAAAAAPHGSAQAPADGAAARHGGGEDGA
ncbi:signal peptidase II [uncultured Desulfovibrio sp.]|uniref:signal peptidase II n=1 Tax=uncultured Desulfovibrio sp. TaxID=167968 RepID=UPI002622DEC6|nr:signal peptidase II [uncultured Desulfovibrio sp.]